MNDASSARDRVEEGYALTVDETDSLPQAAEKSPPSSPPPTSSAVVLVTEAEEPTTTAAAADGALDRVEAGHALSLDEADALKQAAEKEAAEKLSPQSTSSSAAAPAAELADSPSEPTMTAEAADSARDYVEAGYVHSLDEADALKLATEKDAASLQPSASSAAEPAPAPAEEAELANGNALVVRCVQNILRRAVAAAVGDAVALSAEEEEEVARVSASTASQAVDANDRTKAGHVLFADDVDSRKQPAELLPESRELRPASAPQSPAEAKRSRLTVRVESKNHNKPWLGTPKSDPARGEAFRFVVNSDTFCG